MEHKIGEIFEYNGEWYQCIRSILTCSSCEIPRPCTKIRELGCCSPNMRNDKEQVVFKKLEKVGESYTHYCPSGRIIYFQRYKLFYKLYSHNTEYIMCDFNEDGIVSIEIKQIKEDMEEKKVMIGELAYKYINGKITYEAFEKGIKELCDNKEESKPTLKEFNLEAAKSGKPVCTRNGKKARIICFDAKSSKPIIALIKRKYDDYEENYSFYENGRVCRDKDNDYDLIMLPEKKEGWVNLTGSLSHNPHILDVVWDTKEEALDFRRKAPINANIIATGKITWEE